MTSSRRFSVGCRFFPLSSTYTRNIRRDNHPISSHTQALKCAVLFGARGMGRRLISSSQNACARLLFVRVFSRELWLCIWICASILCAYSKHRPACVLGRGKLLSERTCAHVCRVCATLLSSSAHNFPRKGAHTVKQTGEHTHGGISCVCYLLYIHGYVCVRLVVGVVALSACTHTYAHSHSLNDLQRVRRTIPTKRRSPRRSRRVVWTCVCASCSCMVCYVCVCVHRSVAEGRARTSRKGDENVSVRVHCASFREHIRRQSTVHTRTHTHTRMRVSMWSCVWENVSVFVRIFFPSMCGEREQTGFSTRCGVSITGPPFGRVQQDDCAQIGVCVCVCVYCVGQGWR